MSYYTGKLRYLVTRNKVTADQVDAYRTEHDSTLEHARRVLVNQQGPVLQQQVKQHPSDDDMISWWEDVETVIEEN